MEFNKEKQIEKMQPAVKKLIAHLKTKNIEFNHQDPNGFDNCVFTNGSKTFKMSHHSFYRYSGIAVFTRDKGENLSEVVPVTDDMYMNIFMKPILETVLK